MHWSPGAAGAPHGQRPGEPGQLARLLWWAAAALATRPAFESVMVAYYLWPVLAVALVTASGSWPRLVSTSVAAAVITFVSQVSGRGPWIWWASMVAGLGLILFLARVPPRGGGAPWHAVTTYDQGKDRRNVMKQRANLPRWARWAVPTGILVVAGGLLAGSEIPAAQASPLLPGRTPAQLLAALAAKTSAPPLTGTVVETASLGLPALPSTGDPALLSSLLTGSHTIRVWYRDPAHYRIAVPQSMNESDVIRNGSSAWLWDSTDNTVTHVALPSNAAVPSLPSTPLTPQQAAEQALARVGPTTAVSVDRNVTVAREAAYQLVLAPKSSSSLVGAGAHSHRRAAQRAVAGAGVREERDEPGDPGGLHLRVVRPSIHWVISRSALRQARPSPRRRRVRGPRLRPAFAHAAATRTGSA